MVLPLYLVLLVGAVVVVDRRLPRALRGYYRRLPRRAPLLATWLGASSAQSGQLTASAFSIVVLGGLGSVSGSLLAAYIVGYLETVTAYLISPTIRSMPALILLVLVVYVRPQGLLGRR